MKTHLELAKLFRTIDDWGTIGTDTQFKILGYSDEIIFIFRESNSKADWKINFSFPKKPYKQMNTTFYVHGGFLKEWKSIQDHFLILAKKYTKPITVVGWSYGGAMATLCMEDIWFNCPDKRDTLRLVTFGSPRVIGFYNFHKIKQRWNRTTRYSNGTDIVTMVPPVILGFRHVATQTHIGKERRLLDILKSGKNHDITGYITSLEEVANA